MKEFDLDPYSIIEDRIWGPGIILDPNEDMLLVQQYLNMARGSNTPGDGNNSTQTNYPRSRSGNRSENPRKDPEDKDKDSEPIKPENKIEEGVSQINRSAKILSPLQKSLNAICEGIGIVSDVISRAIDGFDFGNELNKTVKEAPVVHEALIQSQGLEGNTNHLQHNQHNPSTLPSDGGSQGWSNRRRKEAIMKAYNGG